MIMTQTLPEINPFSLFRFVDKRGKGWYNGNINRNFQAEVQTDEQKNERFGEAMGRM